MPHLWAESEKEMTKRIDVTEDQEKVDALLKGFNEVIKGVIKATDEKSFVEGCITVLHASDLLTAAIHQNLRNKNIDLEIGHRL